MSTLRFFCPGIPAPKGSAKAFYVEKLKRAVVTHDNQRTRPWEHALRCEAENARPGAQPLVEPVMVGVIFRFPRPKGHYRTNGSLRPSAPAEHTKKPDLDKLIRTVLDALTGVAFVDDAQVCKFGEVGKRYVGPGEPPGADVEVRVLA